ncbi:unnamed protein product [Candidula unifasciata]|uniref:CCDC92/74 N-terminal domain-containing protein n=1 Tax=Candidula unifasciata TaxID=100452 RepID=A0A8S3ZUE1_9EUPU|nr:unnamed protein product [Candidula unifasciata]
MSTETATYKRNLESSILFMQREHAATIKGLHEEISSLQKRCTDLTFQLTMQGLTIDEPGTTNDKMLQLQQELDASTMKISSLEKELIEKDRCLKHLETEARSQRRRWFDESRGQLQVINSLRAELKEKADNIAYLTTELHRLKQKDKTSQTNTEGISEPGRVHTQSEVPKHARSMYPNSTQLSKKTPFHHHFIPVPPADKVLSSSTAASRIRRSSQMKSVVENRFSVKPVIAVHPASATVLRSRQHNPNLLSGSCSSGSDSPDITPFLPQPKEDVFPLIKVKQSLVLPPIPANSSSSDSSADNPHPVLVHPVRSPASQPRQNKTSPSKPEASIVTLAVGNAAVSDAWSFAQESRNSEYN